MTASRAQIEAELLDRARFGFSLQQQGNLAEDERICRAGAINPDDAAAHSKLGNVLPEVERHEDALACRMRAIAAAAMESCDLVIPSDMSVAHPAGALAKTCRIALKNAPDWRWMLDRRDGPWHPTVKLFRQAEPGDRASVFTEMEAELSAIAGNGRGP